MLIARGRTRPHIARSEMAGWGEDSTSCQFRKIEIAGINPAADARANDTTKTRQSLSHMTPQRLVTVKTIELKLCMVDTTRGLHNPPRSSVVVLNKMTKHRVIAMRIIVA